MRAFICVEMPREAVEEIIRVQSILKKTNFNGKLIDYEDLHLTLKFLGDVSEEMMEKVKKKLREVKFNKFEAELGEIGIFHFYDAPRIIWMKINGRGMLKLQQYIDNALEEFFPKERRFMSHVTIARVKHTLDKRGFEEYVKKISTKKLKFFVSEFKLKQSVLEPNGAVYSDLEEYCAREEK